MNICAVKSLLSALCQLSQHCLPGTSSVFGPTSIGHYLHFVPCLYSAQAARVSDIVGTIEILPVLSISSHVELSSGTLPSVQGPTNTSGDIHDDPKPTFDSIQPKDTVVSNHITSRTDIHPEGYEINQRKKESSGHLKCEKEEGELSPSGDFEEDNSVVCGYTIMLAPEEKQSTDCLPCQNGKEEAAILDNDAGAGEEDNENASKAGGDASGMRTISSCFCSVISGTAHANASSITN